MAIFEDTAEVGPTGQASRVPPGCCGIIGNRGKRTTHSLSTHADSVGGLRLRGACVHKGHEGNKGHKGHKGQRRKRPPTGRQTSGRRYRRKQPTHGHEEPGGCTHPPTVPSVTFVFL